jgi:hypothetical protein
MLKGWSHKSFSPFSCPYSPKCLEEGVFSEGSVGVSRWVQYVSKQIEELRRL